MKHIFLYENFLSKIKTKLGLVNPGDKIVQDLLDNHFFKFKVDESKITQIIQSKNVISYIYEKDDVLYKIKKVHQNSNQKYGLYSDGYELYINDEYVKTSHSLLIRLYDIIDYLYKEYQEDIKKYNL